jgi:hypothetical protein
VRTLAPRPGVTIRYVAHHRTIASAPVEVAVVLLAGDNGHLNLAANGAVRNLQGNFLIRSRELFLERGVASVAAVDVPSDSLPAGLDGNKRSAANYAKDIRAVIDDIRARTALRSWVVGTSAGTIGAAAVAARLAPTGSRPRGIVPTASRGQVVPGLCGRTVFDADLAAITVPALVVAHRQDGCACTPPSKTNAILAAFSGSPSKGRKFFTGGLPATSPPCEAFSQHGFFGIERNVVRYIARWIGART